MERTVIILAAGVLLLNFVVVPLLGLRLASRRRAAAAARRRRWPDVEGYASILLSRLMVQTCRVLAFEKACLLVGGGGDPSRLTVVVAHGLDEDVIGRRVPVEGPLRGALQGYRPARTDLRAELPPLDSQTAVAAGVTTPSHSLVLCAAGGDEQAEFGERESVLLRELASLCASALEDLAIKERLDSELGGRAKDLALPSPDERRMPPRTRLDAVSLAVDVGTRLRLEPGALIELELAAHVTEPGSAETPSTRIAAAARGGGHCTPLLHGDPVATAERLARAPGLEVVALIVRCVRERWDGRGPLGLPGMQIPLASRILAACDAARVLTAGPPGGAGETLDIAVRRIQGASGTIFDPTVVTALTHELIGEVPELGADVVAASDWARADSQYAAYH